MSYQQKYLNYKAKYLALKNQLAGDLITDFIDGIRETENNQPTNHIFIKNSNSNYNIYISCTPIKIDSTDRVSDILSKVNIYNPTISLVYNNYLTNKELKITLTTVPSISTENGIINTDWKILDNNRLPALTSDDIRIIEGACKKLVSISRWSTYYKFDICKLIKNKLITN